MIIFRRVELEKEYFNKHQRLQEELLEKDRQREVDKYNQIKGLDQKHEARMRELRDKETKLEEEKLRYLKHI